MASLLFLLHGVNSHRPSLSLSLSLCLLHFVPIQLFECWMFDECLMMMMMMFFRWDSSSVGLELRNDCSTIHWTHERCFKCCFQCWQPPNFVRITRSYHSTLEHSCWMSTCIRWCSQWLGLLCTLQSKHSQSHCCFLWMGQTRQSVELTNEQTANYTNWTHWLYQHSCYLSRRFSVCIWWSWSHGKTLGFERGKTSLRSRMSRYHQQVPFSRLYPTLTIFTLSFFWVSLESFFSCILLKQNSHVFNFYWTVWSSLQIVTGWLLVLIVPFSFGYFSLNR
jgi:hypothetical protein